jgi:hypothetical protein
MLSQVEKLARQADCRYATDEELQFLLDYVGSYPLRLQTYEKLRSLESTLVQQTYTRISATQSWVFNTGGEDMTAKWKMDTVRVLRYSALALLLNDNETHQERFLLWFQTIMKAFNAQRNCEATYEAMQQVVREHLTSTEASLFCPILENNRRILGMR